MYQKILLLKITLFLILPRTEAFEFPQVKNWQVDSVQTFVENKLFQHINGAAESYMKYGFLEMYMTDYHKADHAFHLEVYKHKTRAHAYGIYKLEKPDKVNKLNMEDALGYQADNSYNVFSDRYYIKITDYTENKHTQKMIPVVIQSLIDQFGYHSTVLPRQFRYFSDANKISSSEKYTPTAFLGYGFLENVFSADYVIDQEKFTLFLISGKNNGHCKKMLQEFNKKADFKNSITPNEIIKIDDQYNGHVQVIWFNNYIAGICNMDNPGKAFQYMMKLRSIFE